MEGESELEAIRPLALETGVPDAAILERMEGLPRRGRAVGKVGTGVGAVEQQHIVGLR